ncbi:squalene synthase HpnC [Ramlibacter sp. 2FC]|uniref:squalene synthase HpnC n=1 Tax=Ramlibacter sp. 2FC TaxID=2502188 RepID=UPI0010F593FC|nr:squalene synthase HpnC [Ramlibacter sp. 2FC]
MTAAQAAPVTHYENFPVASWLCPPRLRPAIAAIYWFARTADDIADEGDPPAAQRLQALAAYRAELHAVAAGRSATDAWPQVFGPLGPAIRQFDLPLALLDALLDAFVQDVEKSRDGAGYASLDELLGYCRLSANPVGRLLLHLYGVHDPAALAHSDAICSALQLINFWQDLGVDIPRGRYYLPAREAAAHGLDLSGGPEAMRRLRQTPELVALMRFLVGHARALMLGGAPLVHRVPGRAGWELRLVVQGGLRVLDHIEAQGFATLQRRPALGKADAALMLWRSLRM